ncbi:16S rRNA (guanine(527)-N(7))-methyltransferase RsmG [Parafrankia discariae]|uniref:16S rRNA (guanine(527)-N(7))-methyltransferase RsmG n=1 Tax=Parafrankia discariae TaxID=365528 RepID=UPI000378B07F|nr:16S rRNA (guanine(527)-N(7))-methyltransferase RsmG [Parafrankia discariae]
MTPPDQTAGDRRPDSSPSDQLAPSPSPSPSAPAQPGTTSEGPAGTAEVVPDAARTVFGDRLGLAVRYAELLSTAGVERGLIGPRETGRLWERHLLNSAVLAEAIPTWPFSPGSTSSSPGSTPPGSDSAASGSAGSGEPALEVVDVGSGAGLPGIPLALARPDLRVTLLEPMERRCRFLAEAVAELGLAGQVEVVRGRAPDVSELPPHRTFDVTVARAVAPLGRLGAVLLPITRPGGVMLALRGSRILEELQAARSDLDSLGWREVNVMTCGAGLVDEPTRVLRAMRSPQSTQGDGGRGRRGADDRQARRTTQPRRPREGTRDRPARGRSRST